MTADPISTVEFDPPMSRVRTSPGPSVVAIAVSMWPAASISLWD